MSCSRQCDNELVSQLDGTLISEDSWHRAYVQQEPSHAINLALSWSNHEENLFNSASAIILPSLYQFVPSVKAKKPLHPHLNTLQTIQLRPHIQVKADRTTQRPTLLAIFLSSTTTPPVPTKLALIKVNNIVHPLPTPLHNPIVPIKWLLITPYRTQPPSSWTDLACIALETDELRSTTSFGATAFLPAQDVMPSAFVDGVVDGYYGRHVWRGWIVRLSCHCGEELGF